MKMNLSLPKKTDLKKCKEVCLGYYDEVPIAVDQDTVDHVLRVSRGEFIGDDYLDITSPKNWDRYVKEQTPYVDEYTEYGELMLLMAKRDVFLKDTLQYISKRDLRIGLEYIFEVGDPKSTVFTGREISDLYRTVRNEKRINVLDKELYVYRAERISDGEIKEFGVTWSLNWVDCAFCKLLENRHDATDKIESPGTLVVYRMKIKRDDILSYYDIGGTVIVDYDTVQKTEKRAGRLKGDLFE